MSQFGPVRSIKGLKVGARIAICRKSGKKLEICHKTGKEYWKLFGFKKKKSQLKAIFKDLTKHFKELEITHDDDNLPDDDNTETIVIDKSLIQPFTKNEVQKTISGLKSFNSPGEDLVLNEQFKLSAKQTFDALY